MVLAKVVGNIVSTIKHQAFTQKKLLMVQPVDSRQRVQGGLVLAVDTVGAGDGDLVVVTTEEGGTGQVVDLPPQFPIRSLIVGIVDRLDMSNESA